MRSPLDEVWGVGLCLLAKAVGLLLAAEAGEAAAELVEEEEGVRFAKAAFEGFAVADGEAVVPKDAFGRGGGGVVVVGVAFAGGALGLEEGHARDDAEVVVFRPLAAEAVDSFQEAGVVEASMAEEFADDALVLLLNVGVVVATACA